MANTKKGFDYYKVDTNRYQDRRIKKLRKNFGCVGLAVYDYLLCEIYRDKGCFSVWDEDTAFDVAEYLGIKESAVEEVVKYCGVVGLFDSALLTRGILTSKSIQRRYVEMSNASRRNSCDIPTEIRLTEDDPKMYEECGQNVGGIGQNVGGMYEECGDSSNILPQSKVKKSKEITSLSISPSCEVDESDGADESAEREKIFRLFFFKGFQNPQEEVDRLYAHYAAQGWKRNGGIPITDRVALAHSWKPRDDTKRFSDKVSELLVEWYTIGSAELKEKLPRNLFAAFVKDGKVFLRLSTELRDTIEQEVGTLKPAFFRIFPQHSCQYLIPS